MAKSSKKGKSIESDNVVDINIQLPNVQDIGTQMDKRIKKMSDDFLHFRAGQASPDILSQITVEAYGSRVLLPETSQVTVVSPTKLSLSVFDPLLVKSVANSILTSNLDLTPEVEGNTISIKIPKPSKEARETMAKAVAKAAEKTKTEIRQIRKIALDELKSIKGQVSEDDTRRLSKEVSINSNSQSDILCKCSAPFLSYYSILEMDIL